jgi:predicted RNA-binding protein YlqC (UPF0109 family)
MSESDLTTNTHSGPPNSFTDVQNNNSNLTILNESSLSNSPIVHFDDHSPPLSTEQNDIHNSSNTQTNNNNHSRIRTPTYDDDEDNNTNNNNDELTYSNREDQSGEPLDYSDSGIDTAFDSTKRRRYLDEVDNHRRNRPFRSDEHFDSERHQHRDEMNEHPSSSSSPNPMNNQPHTSSMSPSSQSDSKRDQIELRLLLDGNAAGAIIGKGGETIKRLREQNSAYLNILKNPEVPLAVMQMGTPNRERVMVVRAQASNIDGVLTAIVDILLEAAANREARSSDHQQNYHDNIDSRDSLSLKLLVHRVTVGAVIGKGGETIRATSASTGARIKVSSDALPQSTEKTVTVTGNRSQLQAALRLVIEQIQSNLPKNGTKIIPYVPGTFLPYNPQGAAPPAFSPFNAPFANNFYPPYATAAASGYNPDASGLNGPLNEQKIAIPSVCAGCVIGKGGAILRDLRVQSGCSITVEKHDPNVPNERVVTIKGNVNAISIAIQLIRQCVEQYKPRENHP